jgi:hypothetical protein
MAETQAAAIAAVRQYLRTVFPVATVEDFSAMPERQAHRFRVVTGGSVHLATVSFEFLEHTSEDQIPRRLAQWHLADKMVTAGPSGVLVTEGVMLL